MKSSYLAVLASLFCFMSISCGESSQIAATVNGKSITVQEVDQAFGGKAAQQIYSVRKATLDDLIDQKLLEDAAAAKKVSVDELLKQEVDSKISEPTPEEIKAIYDANKERIGEPLEKVKGQIVNSLKQNRKNSERNQFMAALKQKAKVETKLASPPVARVEVSVDDDPYLGADKAKVTVVEFSDYQCPFCGRARGTVNQMVETYKNDVKYVFRDFPLSFHQDAFGAHVAADCANEQGKYWEYNKVLFNSQTALKPDKLKEYAKQVGLDSSKFNQCLESNKYETEVQKDLDAGIKAGVTGTPTFFINGIVISGAQPFSKFKEIIDAELKK